jgi:hypothetical protein
MPLNAGVKQRIPTAAACVAWDNRRARSQAAARGDEARRRCGTRSARELKVEGQTMLPEVFECPQCKRQFVVELVESATEQSIHCPQCKRYLGEKDFHFVIVTEIEELAERIRFERDRLEKDEAVYTMTDCDAELKTYGTEVHKVVNILRKALAELDALKQTYR